ncbi:MAG: gliding motility lipoprotein GldH [Bacteroidia bacterium]|nr:gliding motility lipoprotein GldH [Bacteroidia bacterium]
MIRKTNKSIWFLISGLLFLIYSCTSNALFIDSVTMKDNTWSLFDNPQFKVPVTDTINSNNIFFTIRTGSKYPFRNIYLFVTVISPGGKSITDTLQYDLADEKGNWYGKGSGDIHELNLPYKTSVFFPSKGTYHFKIQHGMRIGDLKGVYDFGLRVEKFGK